MKHRETAEMREYLRLHLLASHLVSKLEMKFMDVGQLLERHLVEHGHDG